VQKLAECYDRVYHGAVLLPALVGQVGTLDQDLQCSSQQLFT
jgi:hypothetical protein